ncbi:F0F1 ATP synthase subunit epsilon [bacterium]|nr:F0F1 ATP synthase subunit epsilon [bacterium]MBU1882778.1 F0F1 ATP synthase subunit epsilon [bacterium]
MDTFRLEILTPNGEIFNGDVVSATLPGEEGEFGVLAHHASLTTLLQAGVIDLETENKTVESVAINWGVVQVDESKVVVLVDGAVAIQGESESAIAAALAEAKQLIEDVSDSATAIASVSAKLENAAQKLI